MKEFSPVLDFVVISYERWDVVVWKSLAESFLRKHRVVQIFSVALVRENSVTWCFLGVALKYCNWGIGGSAEVLCGPALNALCLLVSLQGDEVGQPDEIKGVAKVRVNADMFDRCIV